MFGGQARSGAGGAAWGCVSGTRGVFAAANYAFAPLQRACGEWPCCSVIIRAASQKANGSRSGGTTSPPMALASKSRRGFTRAGEGAPKVFRSRKNAKVHHGNLKGGTRFRSSRILGTGSQTQELMRRRNPGQGTAGRGRQVRLGLPRRRGALHLRRVLQAGHHPARAGAPRAGRRARGRRLCARHRRRRRGAGHLGPGPDQCGHRHRHRLHGQHPDGDHLGPGADAGDRPRRLPGMRHRRHHAARSSSTTSWSRTSEGPGRCR